MIEGHGQRGSGFFRISCIFLAAGGQGRPSRREHLSTSSLAQGAETTGRWEGGSSPAATKRVRHWKTARSLPPTETSRESSALKRTFITCELCPKYAFVGARSTTHGQA